MKTKYLLYVLLANVLIWPMGCKKILDEQPLNALTAKDALGTPANAEAALTSAYTALLPGMYYGETMNTITELPGDNTTTANGARTMWDLFTFNPSTDFTQNYNQIYNAIAKDNLILKLVPDVTMDDKRKQEILGETYFLRALSYFNLVRLYGGVPVYTEPVLSGDEATINEIGLKARSSEEEVYALILDDLDKAEKMAPATQGDASQNRFKAVTASVNALQAKVYLTMRNWQSAKAAAQKVLSNANYSLATDFNSLWPAEGKAESIFEIDYQPPTKGGGIMPDLVLPYPLATYSFDKYPRPADDLVNSIDFTNDKRFKYLGPIMLNGAHVADNYTSMCKGLPTSGAVDQGFFVYKFRNTGTMPFNNPDNYEILRLADIKLIYAEAENELNGPAGAFTQLNDIRVRAGLLPLTSANLPDKQSFRNEVDKQRRLELAFEGERWFDLIRYARHESAGGNHSITALDVIKKMKGSADQTYLLFPIPQTEINSNPKVKQNPGY